MPGAARGQRVEKQVLSVVTTFSSGQDHERNAHKEPDLPINHAVGGSGGRPALAICLAPGISSPGPAGTSLDWEVPGTLAPVPAAGRRGPWSAPAYERLVAGPRAGRISRRGDRDLRTGRPVHPGVVAGRDAVPRVGCR